MPVAPKQPVSHAHLSHMCYNGNVSHIFVSPCMTVPWLAAVVSPDVEMAQNPREWWSILLCTSTPGSFTNSPTYHQTGRTAGIYEHVWVLTLLSLPLPRFLLWHRWIYHRWHRLLLARGRHRCDWCRQARVTSVLYRRHPPSVQGGQVYYRWDRQRLSIFHTGTTAQGYFRTLVSVHKLGKLLDRCVSSGIFQTRL